MAVGAVLALDWVIGLTLAAQLAVGIALAALIPLAFFRYARSLWLSVGYLTSAGERRAGHTPGSKTKKRRGPGWPPKE